MRKIFFTLITLLVILNIGCSSADLSSDTKLAPNQRLIFEKIRSRALKHNEIGEDPNREVMVYLPPSYYTSEKSYPVIYYLTAYDNGNDVYTNGSFQGFNMKDSLDAVMKNQMVKEMIFVVISGQNRVGGSFYVNSPVTGNWEDFVVDEVREVVEGKYRVIKNKDSRAITGHSMGGTAAFNIACKYPEIYSAIYMISPGLMRDEDVKKMFFSKRNLNRLYRKLDQFENKGNADKKKIFEDVVVKYDYWDFAYGMAFAPSKELPYIDFPYEKRGKQLFEKRESTQKWVSGLGNLEAKVENNRDVLKAMRGIALDSGRREENRAMYFGARYLIELFYRNGIENFDYMHDGDHSSELRDSIEKRMLPFLSNRLKFEN